MGRNAASAGNSGGGGGLLSSLASALTWGGAKVPRTAEESPKKATKRMGAAKKATAAHTEKSSRGCGRGNLLSSLASALPSGDVWAFSDISFLPTRACGNHHSQDDSTPPSSPLTSPTASYGTPLPTESRKGSKVSSILPSALIEKWRNDVEGVTIKLWKLGMSASFMKYGEDEEETDTVEDECCKSPVQATEAMVFSRDDKEKCCNSPKSPTLPLSFSLDE